MKILHVVPSIAPESGGPARAVVDFANIMCKNHEVSIVCTNEGFPARTKGGIHAKIQLDPEVTLKMFSFKGKHSSKFSVFLLRWFKHELIHFDVVHIHAAFSIMSSLAAKECRRQGVPYIFRPLGTLSPYSMKTGNTQFKNWYWKYIERKNCESAQCIHVTSEKEKADVIELGIKVPVVVTPLPVSGSQKKEFQRHSPVRLGVLTRLHPKKNLETLLMVLQELASEYQFELEIAGSGDLNYTGLLQALSETPGLTGRVTFSGFLNEEEKIAFWKRTDYYLLPSHHENFGRAPAEALAAGCPVLLSSEVDISEKVAVYDCGVICDTSPDSVKECLLQLLNLSEEQYQAFAQRATLCAKNEFSPEKVTKQLEEMYTQKA